MIDHYYDKLLQARAAGGECHLARGRARAIAASSADVAAFRAALHAREERLGQEARLQNGLAASRS